MSSTPSLQNREAPVNRANVNHMVTALDACAAQHLERDLVGGGDEGNFFESLGADRDWREEKGNWQLGPKLCNDRGWH